MAQGNTTVTRSCVHDTHRHTAGRAPPTENESGFREAIRSRIASPASISETQELSACWSLLVLTVIFASSFPSLAGP